MPDQRVGGPVAVAADFSCRVFDPCLDGGIRGRGMTYENQTYGPRLTDMVVDGRFTGNRLESDKLTATAGDGSLQASGYVSLAAADGYPMNISAKLDNARLARSDNIGARATGTLKLEKVAGQAALTAGGLRLPATRHLVGSEGAAAVPVRPGGGLPPTEAPRRQLGVS